MIERQREALLRDLRRLQAEIPELIAAVEAHNEDKTNEAVVLLTKGSSGRFQFLMDKLTSAVIAEHRKGNSEPLRMIASGAAFR